MRGDLEVWVFCVCYFGFETWLLLNKHGSKIQDWLIEIGIVVCFTMSLTFLLFVSVR